MYKFTLIIIILVFLGLSCTPKISISGIYNYSCFDRGKNISATLDLKADSTFEYLWRSELSGGITTGYYKIYKNRYVILKDNISDSIQEYFVPCRDSIHIILKSFDNEIDLSYITILVNNQYLMLSNANNKICFKDSIDMDSISYGYILANRKHIVKNKKANFFIITMYEPYLSDNNICYIDNLKLKVYSKKIKYLGKNNIIPKYMTK
jgi:hypothetical protein